MRNDLSPEHEENLVDLSHDHNQRESIMGWLRQVDLDSYQGRLRCQAGLPDLKLIFYSKIAPSDIRAAFRSQAASEFRGCWHRTPMAVKGVTMEYRDAFFVTSLTAGIGELPDLGDKT